MKVSVKEWALFILIALFSCVLWFNLEYQRFAFLNLTVDKKEALQRAKAYLSDSCGIDPNRYSKAIVFDVNSWADRYLQKTKGFKGEEGFIKQHNYELFFWKARFFREFQKEEYILKISPASGDILEFQHLIEDIEPRTALDKDIARQRVKEFLGMTPGIDLEEYDFHEEKIKRYENRTDYSFSWEKKGVNIVWKKDEGQAKLLIGATLSGSEIREFYRNFLDVPEKFQRYIEKQLIFGEYLLSFYFLIFTFLVMSSIFIVVKIRDSLISRFSKKYFISLGIFLALINLFYTFNNIQNVLIAYRTSVSLLSFLGIYLIRGLINLLLLGVVFVTPAIAGEYLRQEVFAQKTRSSFMHYFRSTFYSRGVTGSILFGYVLFFIMLGLQAGMFYLGQRYLGVWKEWLRFTQFSSAYIPFLSAFIVGISASLNEEVIFRLFGITWAKRYLKNTVLAIVFMALVWGFAHSTYAIFPVWFRGMEVSSIGLLCGFVFIRYGLIPLIVAHYLFDVFWGTAAFVLGRSNAYLLGGSLFVLAIPLLFGIIAYIANREEKEREINLILDDIQRYNLGILVTFVSRKKSEGLAQDEISRELIAHNWDIILVDLAIQEVFRSYG